MDERLDVVALARKNEDFRQEIITGEHSQLVAMTIPQGGEIGEEVHQENDQILIFVEGKGQAILGGEKSSIDENDLVFVKAGTRHNFVNTGDGPLRLITIYAPPHHAQGTVHHTKEDADAAER